MKKSCLLGAVCACLTIVSFNANSAVISGTIANWSESGAVQTIGDGTNDVSLWWSIYTNNQGWFYGSNYIDDSDVAFATGISDISQINDASIFSFTNDYIGPQCDADCALNGVGDFVVWRNIGSGYYGVLRIDNIVGSGVNATTLDGTWWFQTDGTGDFSSAAVPVPAAVWLFGSGLLGLVGMARRKKC